MSELRIIGRQARTRMSLEMLADGRFHGAFCRQRGADGCVCGMAQNLAYVEQEAIADSLDAAWAEAEAALPEGWWIVVLDRSFDSPTWAVLAQSRRDWENYDVTERATGEGETPAAALRALAERLREARG